MTNRRDLWIVVLFVLATLGLRWYGRLHRPVPGPTDPTTTTAVTTPPSVPSRSKKTPPVAPPPVPSPTLRRASRAMTPAPRSRRPVARGPLVVPFTVEDGVAVTMGDVVLGVPQKPEVGFGTLAKLEPWRERDVAFHIQPDLPNPERVLAALRLFAGTPIRFTPWTTQDDALVFEPGTGACKSYLGRIGGKQPIWLSPGCGPVEIAHEILHALGFIHEQNRPDRDAFIRVLNENVEPGQEINFAKLPSDYMTFSGLGPFDYTSVMIYPKTMFGVGGRETLESVRREVEIEPTRGLSAADRARLNRAFASKK